MKRVLGAVAVLLVSSVPAWAQSDDPVRKGTVVMSGGTAVTFERLTASGGSGDGSGNSSINIITSQAAMTFYSNDRVGFGPVLAFMHFSLPGGGTGDSGFSTPAKFSLISVGGQVKVRIPMSKKNDFYITGGGGYSKFAGATGYYVGGGAGVDHYLSDRVALNIGAEYTHESISGAGLSGLAVAAGLSVVVKH